MRFNGLSAKKKKKKNNFLIPDKIENVWVQRIFILLVLLLRDVNITFWNIVIVL